MVRVAFHHERLYEIEKLADECYRMCYKPKRIQLRIIKDSLGGFLTSAHLTIENNIGKTTHTELIVYYRRVRWFSSAGIKNGRLDRLHTCLVGVGQRFIT